MLSFCDRHASQPLLRALELVVRFPDAHYSNGFPITCGVHYYYCHVLTSTRRVPDSVVVPSKEIKRVP
jgi:hypothetical protein